MWDQLDLLRSDINPNRIIPTYVGSTTTADGYELHSSNHSHVCGINSIVVLVTLSSGESFPRMWDQLFTRSCDCVDVRIIPTYVGSTTAFRSADRDRSNHSHVCGINIKITSITPMLLESFPRMWDQRRRERMGAVICRIIPTYVGSTSG